MSDSDDPDFRPNVRVDTSKLGRGIGTRSYRLSRHSDSSDSDHNFSTAGNLEKDIAEIVDPIDHDDDMGEQQEAIRSMKDAFEAIALSSKQNDMRTLMELPYFGIVSDPENKKWITDSCNELLDHVDKATRDESWNDSGRIKVLRSKLLGPALEYFNDFTGDTMAEAKTYLLKMFHDPTTHASVSAEIERLKRRNGEQFPYLAIRISKLYAKLKRVSTDDLTDNWIEKSKKELLLKLCPGAVRNFVKVDEDSFDKVLKGVLDYLETNTQHKLTRADIDAERERQLRQINALKEKNANKQTDNNTKTDNKTDETNSAKSEPGTIAGVTNPPETPNKPDQNNGTNPPRGRGRGRWFHRGGYNRGGFRNFRGQRGRGRGRGSFRGGFRRDNRNSGYSNEGYTKDFSNYQCYLCNKYGHIARNCDNSTVPNDSGNTNPPPNNTKSKERGPVTCWTCGGPNHIATNCKQRNFQ